MKEPSLEEGAEQGAEEGALTIIARIKPDQVAPLRAFLDEIGDDVAHNPHIRFTDLTGTHFLRWVVLPAFQQYPAQLVFESNHDGPRGAHIAELVRVGGPALRRIYPCCEGFPPAGQDTPAAMAAFLADHAVPHATFYRAYPGRTVREIRENSRFFALAQKFLDAERARMEKQSAQEIRQALLAHLESRQALGSAVAPPPRTPLTGLVNLVLKSRVSQITLVLLTLPLTVPLLPLAVLFLLILRRHERRDDAIEKTTDSVPKEVTRQENRKAQNQLTHVVEIKPGPFRRCLLGAVLFLIDQLCRHYFIAGSLGGIPSIHFARWIFIDGGRRLLFFSNYDGTWESYLGSFIDLASQGLTAVWSNTRTFPRTRFLLRGGAADEDAFKQWARDHQVPTQVWYSAHASESVRNILDNATIRAELLDPVCGERLTRWLGRL
jgi:hypothetical protein